jgi:hypothetical protein
LSETSLGRMAAYRVSYWTLCHYLGERPRLYVPPARSCLLAKTSSSASFISRSWMMRVSSVRASSMRSRSLESMTKIRPWVPGVPHISDTASPECETV